MPTGPQLKPQTGRRAFLEVDLNDSGDASSEWVRIGMQRSGGTDRSSDSADATNKDDDGWPRAIVTRTPWSLSCDGILDPQDPAFLFLKAKWRAKEAVWVRSNKQALGGDKEYGQALITSLPDEFPEGDAMTYTVEFQGDGPLDTWVD